MRSVIYIPNPKFADATSAERGGWVATSNPALNWYGLKWAIPPTQVVGIAGASENK